MIFFRLGRWETWGAILSGKNSPPHPPRKHLGESFDSLPQDPLSTTSQGGLGPLVWIHPPGLSTRGWDDPGPLLRNGSGVRQVLGFPWGKLSSVARLMRGTYLFSRVFSISPVSLIRQPSGLPPSPKGKAKDQPSVKHTSAAERREKDHVSHRRTRAYTPSSSSRPSTKKGTCEQGYTKRLFFGGLGPQRLENAPVAHF